MEMIFFCPPSFDEQIYYDESMPPIYDDYCDDMYAINNNDNHETWHLDFNFQSHDSYFVEFAPTAIPNEKKFAYVESNKNSMLMHHEKSSLCDSYIVEFIHYATVVNMFYSFCFNKVPSRTFGKTWVKFM